jgi:hypothetical protein
MILFFINTDRLDTRAQVIMRYLLHIKQLFNDFFGVPSILRQSRVEAVVSGRSVTSARSMVAIMLTYQNYQYSE